MRRRRSTVSTLPPDVRKELDRLLMDGALTLDQLREFIAGCGVAKPPSRSALGRYAAAFEKTANIMRESREMARALAQTLGPESVEGEQGRVLVEILRGLVGDVLLKLREDPDTPASVETLQRLARTLKELSHSMHLEQDFAKRIREDADKAAAAKVKAKIDKLGTAEELKALTNDELERKIAELAITA